MVGLLAGQSVSAQAVSGDGSFYTYVATQPTMEWAYRVTADPTSCVLDVTAPSYGIEKNAGSVNLTLPAVSAWTRPGEPRLPVFPAVFELADGIQYQVEVEPGDAGKKQIGYLDPVPTFGNVSETDDEGRVAEYLLPDPAIYRSDAYWPEKLYSIDEAKGGGKRYLRVGLQPFQYNAWNQVLKYHSNLQVKISFYYPQDSTSE